MRFSCAEFPNDNPDLHAGAIGVFSFDGWSVEEREDDAPTLPMESGVARCVDEEESGLPEAAPVTTSVLPPPMDPFNVFVQTVADACIASDELVTAAALPDLFFREETLPGLDGAVVSELRGWRAVLRGESDDLGPCGACSLDEWTAGVLARLCQKASKVQVFRRELRSRGIAAFGLVDAAA